MRLTRTLVAAMVAAAFAVAGPVAAETYTVDPVHTFSLFRIKHLNTSYSYGRIDFPEGSVTYDPAAPEKASFSLTMKTENINTGVQKRDDHLRSASFFNAKEFPTIQFTSTAVKKTGETTLEVTGDLTLHGVKKSITATVEITGTGKGPGGKSLIGFESTINIKRSDFGMNEMIPAVGDEVRLIVSIEAAAR